ncbi:Endothelin-converting enzyme 2 [Desmophyllum pertusum]|uniref:Endothelin-converting enzyme 2 n=1 Tax=Desmophyllum pertusum TaxID=174260 RepID=A0A9X0A6G9_9CNID|nr:Endothelin-converting enzyme 2 [Desmophyllum pertusum]
MSYSLNDWDNAPKSTSTETLGVDRNKNHEDSDEGVLAEKVSVQKKGQNICLVISLILVVLLVIVCVVLSIFLVKEVNKNPQQSKNNENGKQELYCYSPECLQVAAGFAKKMDASIDPCEDFYRHSCASWMKENPIPPSRNMFDTFMELDDQNSRRLRDILEEVDELPDQSAVKKVRLYFESCVNEDNVEKVRNTSLTPSISKYGSWALDNQTWNATQWKWPKVLLTMLRDMSRTPLFEMETDINPRNSSQYMISVRALFSANKIDFY